MGQLSPLTLAWGEEEPHGDEDVVEQSFLPHGTQEA
jgi:hypothetical protein